MPTILYVPPVRTKPDWTCEYCGEQLSATTPKRGHEQSRTCKAKQARHVMLKKGWSTHDNGNLITAVCRQLGMPFENITDQYRKRGWGQGVARSHTYCESWLAEMLEYPWEQEALKLLDPEDERFLLVDDIAETMATLLAPAMLDTTYRAALEALLRLNGPKDLFKEAIKQESAMTRAEISVEEKEALGRLVSAYTTNADKVLHLAPADPKRVVFDGLTKRGEWVRKTDDGGYEITNYGMSAYYTARVKVKR